MLGIFERVRAAFPHAATVQAADLEPFVADLAEAAPRLGLPVVTAEIGDSWIWGAASDPAKLSGEGGAAGWQACKHGSGQRVGAALPERSQARCVRRCDAHPPTRPPTRAPPACAPEYRALLRMRAAARERYDDAAFQRFSRLLLKVGWLGTPSPRPGLCVSCGAHGGCCVVQADVREGRGARRPPDPRSLHARSSRSNLRSTRSTRGASTRSSFRATTRRGATRVRLALLHHAALRALL